jgi:hypothetical protein
LIVQILISRIRYILSPEKQKGESGLGQMSGDVVGKQKYSMGVMMTRTLCSFFCFMVVYCQSIPAGFAQQDDNGYEVAGFFSLMRDSDRAAGEKVTLPGFGGVFTYFPTRHLGLEAEYSFHVERDILRPVPGEYYGSAFNRGLEYTNYNSVAHMALFGVRAGIRKENIGLYAKVRPGLALYHPVYNCSSPTGTILLPSDAADYCSLTHKKEFAMDFGAVVEGYLPNNMFIRFDTGDTYLKFGETGMLFSGSGTPVLPLHRYREDNRHHFHFKIGFGVRM